MEKSSKQKAIQSGMSKKKSAETLTRREDGFGKWLRAGPASALLPIAELVTQRRLELSVEAVTSLPAYLFDSGGAEIQFAKTKPGNNELHC